MNYQYPLYQALISRVRGSAPTTIGDHMLFMQDFQWQGSVGGGQLEWKLMKQIQQLHHWQQQGGKAKPSHFHVDHGLGCSTDQCCGGRVEAHIIPIEPHQHTLFKPGHDRLYYLPQSGEAQNQNSIPHSLVLGAMANGSKPVTNRCHPPFNP